jgi:GTPase
MVALVGLPNAGKSSLLNRILGTKLSIVTSAAQTTRQRVVGLDTSDGVQMVFIDTPGIVDPAYLLHHAMLGIVEETILDADVVVLLLDGTRGPPELPSEVAEAFRRSRGKLVVAINKVDAADADRMDQLARWARKEFDLEALSVSASTGTGLDALKAQIAGSLPLSPFLYPDDELSTQSVRFFVSELIRESVFELYSEEVPYSVATRIEEYREEEDPLFIRATVYVERASQKGILIGHKGEAIRKLGTSARLKIEEFVGRRVYLDLWIKVLPKWRRDPVELRRFGFNVPDRKDRNA